MVYFEIKTPRLLLRPLKPEDIDTTHAYASDRENTRYMMFLPNDTLEETRQFIADSVREWAKPSPAYYEFAVCHEGEHIGGVSLYLEEVPGAGELGWVIRADRQGHGYAAEAAAALMDETERRLDIHHFVAHCDAENMASQAVMRRLGMCLTSDAGTRRNRGSDEERREYRYDLQRTPGKE